MPNIKWCQRENWYVGAWRGKVHECENYSKGREKLLVCWSYWVCINSISITGARILGSNNRMGGSRRHPGARRGGVWRVFLGWLCSPGTACWEVILLSGVPAHVPSWFFSAWFTSLLSPSFILRIKTNPNWTSSFLCFIESMAGGWKCGCSLELQPPFLVRDQLFAIHSSLYNPNTSSH